MHCIWTCNEMKGLYDKIIITIVPGYTGKNITHLLPLQKYNINGNKLMIFPSIALYYGDTYTVPGSSLISRERLRMRLVRNSRSLQRAISMEPTKIVQGYAKWIYYCVIRPATVLIYIVAVQTGGPSPECWSNEEIATKAPDSSHAITFMAFILNSRWQQ